MWCLYFVFYEHRISNEDKWLQGLVDSIFFCEANYSSRHLSSALACLSLSVFVPGHTTDVAFVYSMLLSDCPHFIWDMKGLWNGDNLHLTLRNSVTHLHVWCYWRHQSAMRSLSPFFAPSTDAAQRWCSQMVSLILLHCLVSCNYSHASVN